MTVDTEKYLDFVHDVTSVESLDYAALLTRMNKLELEELGQIMVKQLKNRYHDPTLNKRFVIGVDRAKMKLYDCEQQAQDDIIDSGQEVEYNSDKSKMLSKFDALKF